MRIPVVVTTLLVVVAGQARAAETLFVHASALNLRVKPSASAKARAQVPIGMACDVLARAKDGWAELRCPQGKGFAKLDLLGPKAPEHAVYFKDGTDKARPLSERVNLLQRALALKPADAATRAAFQEVFWAAEFDRLDRARAAKDTLKSPVSLNSAGGCADVDKCARSALGDGVEAAWMDQRVRGHDVIHAVLFADGLLRVRSGEVNGDSSAVLVQLESLSVPPPAVLEALGASNPVDVCIPKGPSEGDGPGVLCGWEYDQNCSPDRCWGPFQDCKEQAAVTCQACKLECGGGCASCRLKCVGGNRSACVARCVEEMASCAASCQQANESGAGECDTDYGSCSAKAQAYWDKNCKKQCDAISACVDKRRASTGGYDYDKTVGHCVDKLGPKLPEDCRDECYNRFQ